VGLDEEYIAVFEFDESLLLVDDKFVEKLTRFKKKQMYYLTGNLC